METRPTKILNRFFLLIFCADALQAIVVQMLNTTMAQFVASVGGNTALAGAISSVITVISLVFSLLAGHLLDRFGRRPILLLGLSVAILAMLVCGALPLLPVFVVFRMIQVAGNTSCNAADGTIVADVSPRERLAEATGYAGFAQSVSTAAGPALGLAIAAALGYRTLYFICAAMLAAALVLALFCNYERRGYGNPRPEAAAVPRPKNPLLRFIEPKALPATMIQFFYFTAASFTVFYLATYAETFSIPLVGLFYTASAIGMLISRLFSGRLADRIGPLPVVLAGILLGICSFVGILLAQRVGLMPLWGGIYGFALGMLSPPLQASAIHAASDARRGVATSTFGVSISVGIGLGGAVYGVMIQYIGYSGALAFGLGLMVVSLVGACIFLRTRK